MRTHLRLLFVCLALLTLISLLALYSVTYHPEGQANFRAQLQWLVIGAVVATGLMFLDYGRFNRPSVLILLTMGTLLLLVAVFIPGIGRQTNGANRWIHHLGQPSEFAKPVVVLLLAAWFTRLKPGEILDLRRGFLVPLAIGGLPAFLIFIEPDWGSAMLIGLITLLMLTLAGARWSHLAVTVTLAAVSLAVLVANNPLRYNRFIVFTDPERYCKGIGQQIWQSLLAIGSGGWTGRFFDGSLHKFGYIPELHTDFIFARVAEETGLWGAALVLLAYLGILRSGLGILRRARDPFGCHVAAGCMLFIVVQAVLNLAVVMSLLPNKGLALPFVSYGGSNLVAMSVCVGLLASVAWHSGGREEGRLNASAAPPATAQLALL